MLDPITFINKSPLTKAGKAFAGALLGLALIGAVAFYMLLLHWLAQYLAGTLTPTSPNGYSGWMALLQMGIPFTLLVCGFLAMMCAEDNGEEKKENRA